MRMINQKEKNNLKKLGGNIRLLREKKGLSFREFSAVCGIDHSKLSKIEKGNKNITFTTILKIAEALEVHPTELLQAEYE
jgi:transcriptional regulator with XRE-family HTH domain